MARVTAIVAVVLLTLLTQIGGLVLLLVWGLSRLALPRAMGAWRRVAINAVLFVVAYATISVLVVPPLAALGGRVPLPCRAQPDRAFAAGSVLLCALNRHYVVPDQVVLLNELSDAIERAFPGTTTLFLDANFPFLNGFPLLPHLSHGDGRKLDLAFYYADEEGRYLPTVTRSPIGYWAFEQPSANDASPCGERPWLSLRWDLNFLQDKFPDRMLGSAARVRRCNGCCRKAHVSKSTGSSLSRIWLRAWACKPRPLSASRAVARPVTTITSTFRSSARA